VPAGTTNDREAARQFAHLFAMAVDREAGRNSIIERAAIALDRIPPVPTP